MNRDLVLYLRRIVNLEKAIFENCQLIEGYTKIVDKNRPEEPKLILGFERCPQEPEKGSVPRGGLPSFIFVTVFFLILCLVTSVGDPDFRGTSITLFILTEIITGASFLGMYFYYRNKVEDEYQDKMAVYRGELRKYEKTKELNEKISKEHSIRMETFPAELETYNQHYNSRIMQLQKLESALESRLKQYYSEEIIYPKYRNFVATATMLEYLESGRCEQLDGPNGAYNLYETEIRQNIVIAQLSAIIQNLSGIQNSQYLLWQRISESQNEVASLLSDIKDDTEISNYYNQTVAKTLKNSIIAI